MNGPTLSPQYNFVLLQWQKDDPNCTPECEECGCDLTDKHVHDVGTGWFCSDCVVKSSDCVDSYNWREDFHADG